MKTKVYVGRSKATGNRVMFYKKPDGQWRFRVECGLWIDAPDGVPNLYKDCHPYLVNNFKEKHDD